jgi:hypothetical protein
MINVQQIENVLHISHFNSDGEINIVEREIPKNQLYNWQYARSRSEADPVYRSWDRTNPYVKKRKILDLKDKT